MNDIKIVFMGTPSFASNILEGLINNGYNIVGVVSQPDKEVGRKKVLTSSLVKQCALKNNIKVFTPNKIKDDYDDILNLNPDLIITCAYGQIIPKHILDYPKYKCINIHGSLLPKGRGGAPIQHSLINGDDITGITLMHMNERMDEGDILYQKQLQIDDKDTNTTLFNKLSNLALEMILEFLPKYFNNDYEVIKQDNSLATYTYNLKKEDEFICFEDYTKNVYNHIRGLLDNPGAFFIIGNCSYKLIDVYYELCDVDESNIFLGLEKDYLRINCKDGFIKIYKIKPEGKNVIDAKSFFNGKGRSLIGLKPDLSYEKGKH